MICDICGKSGVRQRYVSRSYGRGVSLLVIEGAPVMSCPHCGESYLTAQTLHALERIKLHREGVAIKRTVAVHCFCITRTPIGQRRHSQSRRPEIFRTRPGSNMAHQSRRLSRIHRR